MTGLNRVADTVVKKALPGRNPGDSHLLGIRHRQLGPGGVREA